MVICSFPGFPGMSIHSVTQENTVKLIEIDCKVIYFINRLDYKCITMHIVDK